MPTPQELYEETKTRLDLNIAKLQMLQKEIQEKQVEAQGALKQLEKLSDVVQPVESK
jgi:hypothetical protein